eukprot:scaffold45014_cov78-Cyclotella_meneghiniana.AAC.1
MHGLNVVKLVYYDAYPQAIHRGEVQLAPDRYGDLPIHRAVLDKAISVGTIKLMVASNPNVGHLDVVKYLITTYEVSLQICNSSGEVPLQVACRYGKCNIINYILEKSDHGVSTKNAEKKLPNRYYYLMLSVIEIVLSLWRPWGVYCLLIQQSTQQIWQKRRTEKLRTILFVA